ncbi:MAG TPA: hypothetical protein VGG29_12685 [Caulobacteraceae bacterium]|jgi:hypothetical protein
MRTSLIALSAVLALGAAGSAFAGQPANGQAPNQATTSATATPAPKKAAAADDLDKTVCKRDASTGSRIPGPVTCRTRREWAQMAAAAQHSVDEEQTTGLGPARR